MASPKTGGYGGGAVMQRVATISVGIGIAVMILTLAVIFGFKREIARQMSALSGEVVLASLLGGAAMDQMPIYKSTVLEGLLVEVSEDVGEPLVGFAPFVTRAAILRSADFVDGVMLKGLDSIADLRLIERGLIAGELPRFGCGDSDRNVVISKTLANEGVYSVGDKLELMLPENYKRGRIKRDLYRVGAIYENELGREQGRMIFTDIRNVQRANGWSSNEISGYEVWIGDAMKAVDFANSLNQKLLYATEDDNLGGVVSMSIQDLNPAVFEWLAVHDVNAAVVITIMMIVAIFNIITTMLILVLERSHMIGVLKTLGMSSASLGRIFLFRAMSITLWGLCAGNAIALIVCYLQLKFRFMTLDESGYMLAFVPIDLQLWWLLSLNAVVLAVVVSLVAIPTRMVGKIEPTEAIRFQ